MSKRRFLSLFLAILMVCSMIPFAAAGSIYTAKEMKVKHDFQIEGMDDGKGAATYVDVEGGYYISPWKYDVESISMTVTYKGADYKAKTKELALDGLSEVKVSVFEQAGKVVVSTESAPDDAEKIAKFKVDLKTWTVIAMPKTDGLEMAVKYQYKDAKPDAANNVDAYPLNTAAAAQAEAPAGSVQLIQDFKDCKGTTEATKEIRSMLEPDENGVYFASRWNYAMATKEGDAGVGPNIDCKVVYNGANKKMKGEDIKPDANNCGTMYFFDKGGKLDVGAEVPAGATLLAECTMSLDGAIWFTPKSDKITTELEFNYAASETYDEKKNVDQVKNVKPEASKTEEPAAEAAADKAVRTANTIKVNGKEVAFDAYTIGGYTYFKLRDVAAALTGTGSNFDVQWDGAKKCIALTTGKAYEKVEGDLAAGTGAAEVEAAANKSAVTLNGEAVELAGYTIGGNNFFQLRALGEKLGFKVDWDAAAKTVVIESIEPAA